MLVSGITAVIYGREEPFGVLCAHSNINRAFTEGDMSFIQAVANLLGGAIERNEAQERLEEVRELAEVPRSRPKARKAPFIG